MFTVAVYCNKYCKLWCPKYTILSALEKQTLQSLTSKVQLPLDVSQDQVTELCTSAKLLSHLKPCLLQNILDNSFPWSVGMCNSTVLDVGGRAL